MPKGYPNKLYHPHFSPVLEACEDGSKLALHRDCKLSLPFSLLGRSMLAVGGTGSGKTTRLLNPLMFSAIKDPDATAIIVDCQGGEEARKAIQATRKYRGEDPIVFAPLHRDVSARLNFLENLDPRRFDQSMRMAKTLSIAEPVSEGDSRFFDHQRDANLAAVIRALRSVSPNAHLGEVAELFSGGYEKVKELADKASCPELERVAYEIRGENRNTQTTFCCIVNSLLAFRDANVASAVESSTFSWEQLERKPSVFIYLLEEHEVSRLLPLTNIMIDQLLTYVMGKSSHAESQLARPFYVFLDEFASAVGKIEGFHLRINTLRKRGLAFIGAVQSLSQILSVYGENDGESTIQGFTNKVFVPPVTLSDARRISEQSGITSVEQPITKPDGFTIDRIELQSRPLLSVDDVQNPVKHPELGPKMTFMFADRPPFQGYLGAAWEDEEMREFLNSKYTWKDLLRFNPRRVDWADNLRDDDSSAA